MKRLALLTLAGTGVHLLVSLLLAVGLFGASMASFNRDSRGEINVLNPASKIWHAGYFYIWSPVAQRLLTQQPAVRMPPKSSDPTEVRSFDAYRTEVRRIASIHTSGKNLGLVFSSILGGFVIALGYAAATRKGKPNKLPLPRPGGRPSDAPSAQSGPADI